MKLIKIVKRTAGHYTATTPTGTYAIDRIGRTWHLTGHRVALAFRTMRAAVAAAQTLRPTSPVGGMTRRLTKLITRTHAAAQTVSKALAYRARSGAIAALVEAGRLVRTGDILDRLGASDLKDGYQSHYGKHVVKAYRAATSAEPVKVWVQHRTTGKYVHVNVYSPFDMALYIGLATYKRTAHLARPAFYQAAYTEAA
ncbi:hypothetical protein [Streptomyces sp. NPDC056188]|uniref:hypothetical protein n=1 Tax=Streptomyces sp. NPDC056188 TaxID=3345740 RepID=UPI0035DF718B